MRFYILFVGGIDILLHVRLAFAATIASLVMLSIGDANTAWKNRNVDWGQLGLSVDRLVGEIGTLLGLIVLTFLFLVNPHPTTEHNLQSTILRLWQRAG